MKKVFIDSSAYIAINFTRDQFHKKAIETNMLLLDEDYEYEEQAFQLFKKYSDKEYSLTDCVSFVVMKEKKLTKAFTNDHHFEQMGFEILIK